MPDDVGAAVGAATSRAADDSPLGDTEVHHLRSSRLEEEYRIFVGRCSSPASRERRALLLLTDANGFFGAAVDIVRSLQLSKHVPPMLVVGVGYRAAILAQTLRQRTRDLTPTRDERYERLFPDQSESGGADRFLAFLGDELLPWVRERYEVDTGATALFGHSFGGLFATHVLLTAPETFTRYAIGSPSYWWDREVMFGVEQRYAAAHDDLAARVFMGIGALETHEGRQREASNLPPAERAITASRHIDMVGDMQRMAAALRSRRYPGLRLDADVYAGEFHISVPTLTLSRALRTLFDAPR